MENATKALLIAGAVLVVIVIISLGMMIFNAGSGVIEDSTGSMTEAQVQVFNAKFTKYEGTQTGSSVKALISEVNSSNYNSTYNTVILTGLSDGDSDSKDAKTDYSTSSIISTKKYTVTIEYQDGVVYKINIK